MVRRNVRRVILTGNFVHLKTAGFKVLAPCSLVEGYERFGGTCCGQHTVVRTSRGHIRVHKNLVQCDQPAAAVLDSQTHYCSISRADVGSSRKLR
jgi:hypothetical protein